jgi:Rrf2 family protein
MLITSKGRYGLRLMIYVASFQPGTKIALRQAAAHEDISLKYLEQVARSMVSAGLLESVRGHGGGYRLARDPHKIKAGDVLRAAEGETSAVACAGLENQCPREQMCSTVAFWTGLDRVIEDYVDSVTLAELVSDTNTAVPTLSAMLNGLHQADKERSASA